MNTGGLKRMNGGRTRVMIFLDKASGAQSAPQSQRESWGHDANQIKSREQPGCPCPQRSGHKRQHRGRFVHQTVLLDYLPEYLHQNIVHAKLDETENVKFRLGVAYRLNRPTVQRTLIRP